MTAAASKTMDAGGPGRRAWTEAAIAIALGTAALLLAFREPALAALRVWSASATYNHCFLVVPISAWMLRERRAVFSAMQPRPAPLLPAVPTSGAGPRAS